jgi:hypothetical protein
MASSKVRRAWLFPILLTGFATGAMLGDTISTWNGGTGNWGTASNWTPPVVPNNSGANSYDVTIASGGTDAVNLELGLNPTVTSLTVGGDPYFNIDYNETGGYVSITAQPVPELTAPLLTGFAVVAFGAYGVRRFRL